MNRMCLRRARAWLPGLVAAWLCAAGAQAQGLTLHYQERAPYSAATPDGGAAGLVATPAAQALQAAGIPFGWARTPSQRQLALIQEGSGLHCGVGWFRNPERAALGKFSRALYRDRPLGALVRSDSRVRPGLHVEQALALPGEVLLVKEGYSYGPEIDRLLAAREPAPARTAAETAQMLRMLLGGRASWMFASPEEAGVLLAEAGAAAVGLRQVGFAGAAPGLSRHLYCSRAVPDAWIARIDQALAAAP
jgi:hypothetical protein